MSAGVRIAAAQRECDHTERRILVTRLNNGRHVLELLRWQSEDAILEALADYCTDVETLCRGRGDLLAAALSTIAALNKSGDSLREQNIALREELRRFRQEIAA